jgi:hypothetical protein
MVGLAKRRLLSERGSQNQSNSRVAWMVAGSAIALILTLPAPADAQSGADFTGNASSSGRPSIPFASGARTSTTASRPKTDLIDISDRMDPATRAAGVGAIPSLTSGADVICLAGCDGPAGKVVFHGAAATAQPALAAIDANNKPLIASIKSAEPTPADSPIAAVNSGVITCLAGCYGETHRTAAVMSGPTLAAKPMPGRSTIQMALVSAPKLVPPSVTEAAPKVAAAVKPKAVKLRTAFAPHQRSKKAARRYAAKPRATTVAMRKPAAVITVAAALPALPVAPAQPVTIVPPIVTAVETTPAPAPAKAVAITIKPEKRKTERTPVAAVSNDWFNRINRERKAAKAAATE